MLVRTLNQIEESEMLSAHNSVENIDEFVQHLVAFISYGMSY